MVPQWPPLLIPCPSFPPSVPPSVPPSLPPSFLPPSLPPTLPPSLPSMHQVADLDLKAQGPVGNGRVICISIYGGPDVDFGHGKGTVRKGGREGGREGRWTGWIGHVKESPTPLKICLPPSLPLSLPPSLSPDPVGGQHGRERGGPRRLQGLVQKPK
jgi:hypothetical protein